MIHINSTSLEIDTYIAQYRIDDPLVNILSDIIHNQEKALQGKDKELEQVCEALEKICKEQAL